MIKKVEINLEPLYKYGVQFKVEDLLNTILSNYEEIEYRLLYAASPDIDVKYYSDEFKEYVEEHRSDVYEDILELAAEYAEKKQYEAIVWLFDGYEEAVAAIKEKEVSGECG